MVKGFGAMTTPEYVKERLEFYSNNLKVPMPKHLILDEDEYAGVVIDEYNDYYYANEIKSGHILGSNYDHGSVMFINLKKDRTAEEIEETCIHEILHTKYPNMPHGSQFYHYIKQIKEGNYNPKYGILRKFKDWIS